MWNFPKLARERRAIKCKEKKKGVLSGLWVGCGKSGKLGESGKAFHQRLAGRSQVELGPNAMPFAFSLHRSTSFVRGSAGRGIACLWMGSSHCSRVQSPAPAAFTHHVAALTGATFRDREVERAVGRWESGASAKQ